MHSNWSLSNAQVNSTQDGCMMCPAGTFSAGSSPCLVGNNGTWNFVWILQDLLECCSPWISTCWFTFLCVCCVYRLVQLALSVQLEHASVSFVHLAHKVHWKIFMFFCGGGVAWCSYHLSNEIIFVLIPVILTQYFSPPILPLALRRVDGCSANSQQSQCDVGHFCQ